MAFEKDPYNPQEILPIKQMERSNRYGTYICEGQFNDQDLLHGIGRKVLYDRVEEGQFQNGVLHGVGRIIKTNGLYHIGWLKDQVANGYGRGNM